MRLGMRGEEGKRAGLAKARVAAAASVALAVGILSGCSSFFSGSSGTSHVIYIAGTPSAVAAFRINDKTGAVSNLVSAPYVAGNSPSSVVADPSGRFLYVANALDNTISLFAINSSSGALTEVLPRTSSGLTPSLMAIDSGGTFLFVADQGGNDVESFQIGAAGGLTPVSSLALGDSPAGLVLTSSGQMFVPLPNFSDIAIVSESSGVLQLVGFSHVTNGVAGIAVDSAAKFLYATNPATNTVSGFAIQPGGSLTPVPGLTAGTGATPVAAAVDLTGTYLYVANTGGGSVSQFSIDATTGALTALSPTTVTVGTNPAFVVIDPGGKFVFVGNEGSKSVTELTIGSTGLLSNSNTISLNFVPRSLAVTK